MSNLKNMALKEYEKYVTGQDKFMMKNNKDLLIYTIPDSDNRPSEILKYQLCVNIVSKLSQNNMSVQDASELLKLDTYATERLFHLNYKNFTSDDLLSYIDLLNETDFDKIPRKINSNQSYEQEDRNHLLHLAKVAGLNHSIPFQPSKKYVGIVSPEEVFFECCIGLKNTKELIPLLEKWDIDFNALLFKGFIIEFVAKANTIEEEIFDNESLGLLYEVFNKKNLKDIAEWTLDYLDSELKIEKQTA
jgi:hypothetical protein